MRLVSAITQRNKLIRLGFEGFGINALDKSFFEPLTEYYSNVITQEQELTATSSSSFGSCGLKSLQIIYCHGLTSKALQHVAKMKTLQKLTIILSPLNTHTKKNILSSNLSANPIDGFTRELTAGGEEKVLPLLSYLELVNVILSDQAIQDIIACKSLKTLLVEQARGFSKTGERLLKKHIESLSSNNI
ncbi:hypothetical protein BDA99DRAFT_494138 [Phascolomyces articulosus]|uniref:Uncharacterized protein n=1 Tax=Phascolomyces articulosus TaxID=60185 RepID=A0AAD5KVF7_9FUNG|nr:hypothetical protein BDA99DRAFT_494138 [Phascolomyces articulosus]